MGQLFAMVVGYRFRVFGNFQGNFGLPRTELGAENYFLCWPAVSQPDRATLQKTNVLSVCPRRPPPPLGSSPLFGNSLPTRQTPAQNPSSEPPSAMVLFLFGTLLGKPPRTMDRDHEGI